jgi:transcriptional regulator
MYRMVLTRQQREKLVLDLYNQGKNTREIAQEVRMSFRDISAIVDKARKDEEKRRSEKMSQSSQAYNSSSSPTTIKLIDGYSSY